LRHFHSEHPQWRMLGRAVGNCEKRLFERACGPSSPGWRL
jgi:hypothetical protein